LLHGAFELLLFSRRFSNIFPPVFFASVLEEEQRRLEELLAQCHDYIYACHAQNHPASSSKIITNGSLTSRAPSSPHRDVTSGVMAACWLELPVASSRNEFPFPAASDVGDRAAVTSRSNGRDDVSKSTAVINYYYYYYYYKAASPHAC